MFVGSLPVLIYLFRPRSQLQLQAQQRQLALPLLPLQAPLPLPLFQVVLTLEAALSPRLSLVLALTTAKKPASSQLIRVMRSLLHISAYL